MTMEKNQAVLIGVLAVVILGAVAGYFYYKNNQSTPVPEVESAADVVNQGVLPSIGEAGNPLSNKPDLNPTSKTNPFESVKTNPFD